MVKEQFRTYKPQPKTKVILEHISVIVQKYQARNIPLTLRQLYYQLVAQNIIENTKETYKALTKIVGKARYAGMLDWTAFKDRTRTSERPMEWKSITDLLKTALYSYRLPRGEGQENYIEVITEKDALSSVLAPIAARYHIRFNVFKGFSSITAIYDLSKRILAVSAKNQKSTLVYIGDHDPSGLQMLRGLHERIGELTDYTPLTVIPAALTMEQITELNLAPNRAKEKDPNYKKYKAEFGEDCWEVDALPPEYLIETVKTAILQYLDVARMNAIIAREEEDKRKIKRIFERFDGSA